LVLDPYLTMRDRSGAGSKCLFAYSTRVSGEYIKGGRWHTIGLAELQDRITNRQGGMEESAIG
jgi:hypothetical protein